MFSKINLTRIIVDHFRTLNDANTGVIIKSDVFVMFGIPAIIGIVAAVFNFEFEPNLISLLVTSLSIFAALLFNLLLLIYDIVRKSENGRPLKASFLQEIYSNISFCILISILAVLCLIVSALGINLEILNRVIAFLIVFLLCNFILSMLMVLKRVHALLTDEFVEIKKSIVNNRNK